MIFNASTLKAKVMDQSALLTAFSQDIEDTVINANKVLDQILSIYDMEGLTWEELAIVTNQLSLPVRICCNYTANGELSSDSSRAWYIYKDNDSGAPVIGHYDDGSGQLVLDTYIFNDQDGKPIIVYDYNVLCDGDLSRPDFVYPTIHGLMYAASDTLGQATVLGKLTDLIGSGREDILTSFAITAGNYMDKATTGTKMLYSNITDSLTKLQGSKIAGIVVLKNIYQILSNITVGSTGQYYEFDNTDYRVQGFAASNLVAATATALTTVVGVLVATVSPILAMAVMMLPGIIDSVSQGVTDILSNNQAKWSDDSVNNLFNVPIWQGTLPDVNQLCILDDYNNVTSFGDLVDKYGVCSVSLPGLWLVLWRNQDNANRLNCECYVNCNIKPIANAMSITQTFSGYQGSGGLDYKNGSDYLTYGLFLRDPNDSYNSIRQYPDIVRIVNGLDTVSLDVAAKNAVMAAISMAVKVGLTRYFGYNVSSSTMISDGPVHFANLIAHINAFFNGTQSGWEHIVNTVCLTDFRNLTESEFFDLLLLPYFPAGSLDAGTEVFINQYNNSFSAYMHRDFVAGYAGTPARGDFFITAPTYGSKAVFNTVMIGIGIALATTAIAVTAAAVRIKIRNSQIRAYAKVANAAAAYQADPTNKQLEKQYIRTANGYNIKSNLLGYSSKVNMVDGWQETSSQDDNSKVNLTGIVDSAYQSKLNYNQLLSKASTQDVTDATSGLATPADITQATSGLATPSDITQATSGLATPADVATAVIGLATKTDLSTLATKTDVTNNTKDLATKVDVQNSTSSITHLIKA